MGCYNSIVINASSDKVWNVLKSFHHLSWSKNVVTKVDVIGDKPDGTVGAKRIINEAFHETLQSIDQAKKTFSYSIDDGPAAVSKDNVVGYIGKVSVLPVTADNSSFVLWTSEWTSTKNNGVADFCDPIYHALLNDLKLHFS
jgi:hypothetical protein